MVVQDYSGADTIYRAFLPFARMSWKRIGQPYRGYLKELLHDTHPPHYYLGFNEQNERPIEALRALIRKGLRAQHIERFVSSLGHVDYWAGVREKADAYRLLRAGMEYIVGNCHGHPNAYHVRLTLAGMPEEMDREATRRSAAKRLARFLTGLIESLPEEERALCLDVRSINYPIDCLLGFLEGASVEVEGSVGNRFAHDARGCTIVLNGNAGHLLGHGAKGCDMYVEGSVGDHMAEGAKGSTLTVTGDAGIIDVGGNVYEYLRKDPARGNKMRRYTTGIRGCSIVVNGGIKSVLPFNGHGSRPRGSKTIVAGRNGSYDDSMMGRLPGRSANRLPDDPDYMMDLASRIESEPEASMPDYEEITRSPAQSACP